MITEVFDETIDARIKRGIITTVVSAMIGIGSCVGGVYVSKNNPHRDHPLVVEKRQLDKNLSELVYEQIRHKDRIKHYSTIGNTEMTCFFTDELEKDKRHIHRLETKIAAAEQTQEFQSYFRWQENCKKGTYFGAVVGYAVAFIAAAYTAMLKREKDNLNKTYS